MFEFLLVNHPLDCPVCDKGGECPLQDFSYTFGPDGSRMDFPRRVFDGEGVKGDVDFGPTLMLNRQRCILCTRCVRFMREVDGDAQINIIDRGYGSEIATFQEEGVHSLVSGNLMDVCPVGAITTRDYRFKSRPWDNPEAIDTICTQCSKGCSTTAWLKAKPEWAKGSRLIRFTPRFNPDVNGYWMCDIGRFNYHWIEGDEPPAPAAREGRGGRPAAGVVARREHEARGQADGRGAGEPGRRPVPRVGARVARRAVPVPAPGGRAGRQRAGDHGQLAHDAQAAARRARSSSCPTWMRPTLPAPARSGSRAADSDTSALRALVEAGKVAALYVFDPGPDGSLGLEDDGWIVSAREKGTLPLLVVQGVLLTRLARAADVVLPGASYVEKEASYTNDGGRLQAASRVLPLGGDAMDDWRILVNLAEGLGVPLGYTEAAQVRADIARAYAGVPELAGIAALAFGSTVPAQSWLQASNPSERWKWNFLFQDLPPVKGSVELSSLPLPPMPPGAIPLKEVK